MVSAISILSLSKDLDSDLDDTKPAQPSCVSSFIIFNS